MSAAEISGALSGVISVGCSTIPSVYIMPALLVDFLKGHPGIEVTLLDGDTEAMIAAVQGGAADLALVGHKPDEKGLQASALVSDEIVLVAAPGHPLGDHEAALSVDEALRHSFVGRRSGSGTASTVSKELAKLTDRPLLNICEMASTEAQKAAVVAGLGPGFVSRLAVEEELERGRLQAIALEGFQLERTFWLVSRDEERLNPAARVFRDGARVHALATSMSSSRSPKMDG